MNFSNTITLTWARKGYARRGFTLVELLVAMTIATIIFAIVWKFLDSTANASREITSASATIDDARIGLEEVSKHLQLAAAHASPNSSLDRKIRPAARQANVGKITGIYPYDGWQGSTIWNDGDSSSPPTRLPNTDPIFVNNPNAVFNGLIVLGSISYPLAFETRVQGPGNSQLVIPPTPRGLNRLNNLNPFIVSNVNSTTSPLNDPQWTARLVQVLDAEGFKQFSGINAVNTANNAITLTLPLSSKGSTGANFGIENALGASDRYYSTATLDMFWFRIRRDPDASSPNNLQLVRDRLCARTAITDYLANPTNFNPVSHLAGTSGCGQRETIVIANQVADFNVWFDCAQANATGAPTGVTGLAPPTQWNVVNNNCVNNRPNAPLQLARIAHVRLSTYTSTERKSLTDPAFYFRNERLVAFDANPEYGGASPVTTLQSDVFMRNFLYW